MRALSYYILVKLFHWSDRNTLVKKCKQTFPKCEYHKITKKKNPPEHRDHGASAKQMIR